MKKAYTKEYISHLLCCFMNGETTLDEERMLEEYFRIEKHIPEDWADYKEMVSMGLVAPEVALGWRFGMAADTPEEKQKIREKWMPVGQ